MSESERPFKLLPVDNDVVIDLPEGTIIESFGNNVFDASESSLYISAKELKDEVVERIFDNLDNSDLFARGIKVRLLEPPKTMGNRKDSCALSF